jgi:hypothetical protein
MAATAPGFCFVMNSIMTITNGSANRDRDLVIWCLLAHGSAS